MTKQEIIDYMYENHVQGDFKIEEMAEDLAQPEIIRCKDCRFYEFKQGSLPWNNSRRYCNRSVSLSTQESDYCSYAELRGDSYDNH